MNFTRMPPILDIAVVKLATSLWGQADVCNLIKLLGHPVNDNENPQWQDGEKWQAIEDKVVEKVSQLQQPKRIKFQVIDFIKPIGFEIYKWLDYHLMMDTDIIMYLPFQLFWTLEGAVDGKKTAEILMKQENLHITLRYKLACIYCLENYIKELWNTMPEDYRTLFYSKDYPQNIEQLEIVVFWTYHLEGEATKLTDMCKSRWYRRKSPYQYAFECAAFEKNKVAVSYFLQKLTYREREQSLLKCARRASENVAAITDPRIEYCSMEMDILCFMLSQMSQEQQIRVYKWWALIVLNYFLYWPLQYFFMEVVNRVKDFLENFDFFYPVKLVIFKLVLNYSDYNYQEMFVQCWQIIPDSHRVSFLENNDNLLEILIFLISYGNKTLVKLVLNDVTLSTKENLIFTPVGESLFKHLITKGSWSLFELFIAECSLTNHEIIILDQKFEKIANTIRIEKHSTSEGKVNVENWLKNFQRFRTLYLCKE